MQTTSFTTFAKPIPTYGSNARPQERSPSFLEPGGEVMLTCRLFAWAEPDGRGVAFDSSTEFRLPNGAARMADASWVERSRLALLTRTEAEISTRLPRTSSWSSHRHPTAWRPFRTKMTEWMENGAQLGWLIDA